MFREALFFVNEITLPAFRKGWQGYFVAKLTDETKISLKPKIETNQVYRSNIVSKIFRLSYAPPKVQNLLDP